MGFPSGQNCAAILPSGRRSLATSTAGTGSVRASNPSRCEPMLIAALAIYFKELFFFKKKLAMGFEPTKPSFFLVKMR